MARSNLPLPGSYSELLNELKERVRVARLSAAVAVNRELIELYWRIGREILDRQAREGWGAKVIDRLAIDLRAEFPDMTGFSPRNLKYMRSFADAYPDLPFVQQAAAQLPWGHHLKLLDSVKEPQQRQFYVQQAAEQGWSRNVLANQIASDLYHRQGKALTNFERTLPSPQSELAQQLIKDPYSFEFLSLTEDTLERDLERGLLDQLRALILELGKGFSFVGSQYPLEIGGQDYRLDLLFYHLKLRCFVVIELKIEDFKPEFAGKMNFYLSAVDDKLRHPDDQASIGIILCKTRNAVIVEYALRDSQKPMGVAEYTFAKLPANLKKALPSKAELSKELPSMALVQMRIELEQQLRRVLAIDVAEPMSVSQKLRSATIQGLAPADVESLFRAIQAGNAAAHGRALEAGAAAIAQEDGERVLALLRALPTANVPLTDT